MICLPIGLESWIGALTSQAAIAFIIGAAGISVSIITLHYQRKQQKTTLLFEVFRMLNLPEHREARKVTYGKKTDASYDILKIRKPDFDWATSDALERASMDMVRGDINNAATLIHQVSWMERSLSTSTGG